MNNKPTLHMIGLFHTICNHDYDHCAFTGKVMRFATMMKRQGYTIIEYSNGVSMSDADEQVQMMTADELFNLTKTVDTTTSSIANMDSPQYRIFDEKLTSALKTRVKTGDIVCHPFGPPHAHLVKEIPEARHVETGIGYPNEDFGAFRIFESYAWMHFHQGKNLSYDDKGNFYADDSGKPIVGRAGKNYEWVVPNYYNVDDWEPSYEPGQYLLYFGRVVAEKGIAIVKEIASRSNMPIRIVGAGNLEDFAGHNMQIEGPLTGAKERSDLLRNAKAVLMPTRYIEPFGGVAIEAMLCGTPVISSDFGAFTETLEHGKTGFRCHTLGDYLTAVVAIEELDREYISNRAREDRKSVV